MNRTATLLAVSLLLALPAAGAPSLVPLEESPVDGRAMTLELLDEERPAAGVAVTAVYRENAHASLRREQPIGTTDAAGSVTWTPDAAGVVVLQWEGGSENVSVLHDGSPFGAVLIAILAGIGLLGGSVVFFLQMLRQPKGEIIEELEEYGEPPST